MLRSFRAARRLYSSTNLQLKSFHPRSSSLAVPHRSLSVSPSSSSSFLSLRRTFSTSPADTTSSLPSALSATYGFIDSDKKDHYSEVLSDSEEVIASEQEEIASLSPWYELENELMHDFAREFFLLGPREREERLHRISTLYSNINPDYRSMSDEEIEDRHQLLKERVERLLPTPSLHPVYDADFILYGKGTEKKEQKQLTKKELYESTEGITNEYTGRHLLSESDEELISEAQYRFFRRHVNNKRAVMQAGKKFEMDPETKRTFIHFLYESFEGDGATKDEQLKRWSGLASARWSSADADIENWCKEKERSDRYVSAYNRSVARMYCEAGGDSAGASMYAAGEERNEFDDLFEEKEKKMKEKPSKDAQHTKKIHEKLAEDAAAEERANDLEVGLTDARALKVKLLKKTRGQSTEKFTKEEIGQLLYLIEKATGESLAMEESKILKSFTPYELYVLFELHEVDESPDPKDIEEAEKDKMIREKYESQDDNDLRRISAAFEGKYISPPSDYQPRPLTRFERCLRRALKDDRRAHLLEKFSADFNRKVDAALEERRRRYLEEITEVYIANKEKGVKAEEGGMLKDFEGLAKMMQRQFVESGQARRILDEMLRDYDKKTQKFVLDAYLNGDLRLDLTGGMFNKIDYANLLESVKANAAKSESDDALTLVDNTDDVPVVDELLYDDDEELSKEELEDRRAFENEMSERVDYLKSVISSVVGPPLPKEEPIPSFDHIRTDDEEFTKEVREALQKAYVERRDYDKMIDNLLVSLKIKKPEELSDDPLGELFPDTTVDRDYRQLEKDAQQKQLARDAKRQQKIKNVYLSILGADNPLAKKLSEIDEWNDNEQFFTLAPFHMESIESKIDELNAKRIEAKKNGLPTDLDFEFLLKKRKEYDTAIKKRDEAKDDLVRAVLAANAKLSRAQQALSTLQKDDKKIEFSLSDKDKIPFDYDEELEKLPGADFIATLESLKTPPAIDALARCHLAEEILEKRRDVLIKHLRDAVLDEDPTFAHEIGAIAELNLYAENRILRDAAGYIDSTPNLYRRIRRSAASANN